jgi:voltage-gated potassium channel
VETLSPRRFGFILLVLVGVLAGGTIALHQLLHDGWIDAFYRAFGTVSLAGIAAPPHQTGAEVVTIILLAAGVALFAYIGAVIVEAIARGVLTGALAERRRRRAIEALRDHYIICGFGRVGRRVAEEFRRAGASFIVLDFSEEAISTAREENVLFIEGNGTEDEDLARAGLDRARGLVAASDDDSDNLYITLSAKAQRPDLVVVARASDEEAEKKLRLAGADRVVLPYATAGRVMANLLVKPQVTAFLNVVSDSGGPDLSFEEIEIQPTCEAAGRSIRDLRVREQTGASIVAVRRDDGTFDTSPTPETTLDEGDVLVGVGTADQIRALEDLFAPRERIDR